MKLILASKSPRRKELLEELGFSFIVCPATKDEVFDKECSLDEALERVAMAKANEVFEKYPDDCILSADTIVVYQNRIYGKPSTKEEALSYLQSFSGHTHEVKTGVCIRSKKKSIVFVKTTRVTFRTLSTKEMEDYVSSGTCMDKAGAYGIQECDFIESIQGSYSNVVGLPQEGLEEEIIACMSEYKMIE